MATHSCIFAWKIPGQRSLVGYSPWGWKVSDTTEQLSTVEHTLEFRPYLQMYIQRFHCFQTPQFDIKLHPPYEAVQAHSDKNTFLSVALILIHW